MLRVNTVEFFSKNYHENRVYFPEERSVFVFDHQHSRRHVQTSNSPFEKSNLHFLALNTCLAFFSPPGQKTMQRQTVSSMPSFLSSSARAVRTSANLSGLHSNGILIFFHNQDKFHNTLRSLRAFQYHNLKPQKHLETAGAMFLGSCYSVPQ